jgi:hypothetical protein
MVDPSVDRLNDTPRSYYYVRTTLKPADIKLLTYFERQVEARAQGSNCRLPQYRLPLCLDDQVAGF